MAHSPSLFPSGSRMPSAIFSIPPTEGDDPQTDLSSQSPPSSPFSEDQPAIADEDIAIIGYACRVPGGNNSPSELWDFLLKEGDASGEIPEMRWKPYQTRQPGNDEILSKTTSKGYFLDKLEDFDAAFFGISPREAEQIDPQQRLAVEVAWEALEAAGIAPQSLSGSDTAVFMGVNSDDYSRLLLEDLPRVQAWMGIGTAFCGIPNRISYLLNLMGPSTAIDAACASSLVAIHHGRQALRAQETSLVIAGGVNALIGPGLTRVLDEAGAIASDGRCRSFDESACGYGRGEGAGVVILKRLSDAVDAEDNILAVLKGSAVGADGKTNGIMAPNQEAQEQVARKALREARFAADTIAYVEAHATSTPLGDPTECAAMANVYGRGARKSDTPPCYIGSIKPNIGHLEAGAGVLGFIKAIMVIQNALIPPQANLTELSSKFNFKDSMLVPVTKATSLSASGTPLRAAIASYGYGGTVSHAVIEAPPLKRPSLWRLVSTGMSVKHSSILVLSGQTESRLKASAATLIRWITDTSLHKPSAIDLQSLSYTLAVKRGHHKFRAAVVSNNIPQVIEALQALSSGQQSPQLVRDHVQSEEANEGAVWVFSGHGAQWDDMGKQLLESEPAFASVINRLEPVVYEHMQFSITTAFRQGDFQSTERIQVMTYAMQTGLAEMLKALGLKPSACIGHSLGELAASVVAGCLTLEEGARICCIRAQLYMQVAGAGAMALISIPFLEAARALDGRTDLAVAIDSSPSSCVVSGTVEAVAAYMVNCESRNITAKRVKTDVAFHSLILAPLAEPLRQGLGDGLYPRPAVIPLYSTSTSDPRSSIARDVDYWIDNMIKPVMLTPAVLAAGQDGKKVFLEVSSHPIVTHSINETLMDAGIDGKAVASMLRNKDSLQSLLFAVGRLHCSGASVDFRAILPGTWLHDVPRTEWEHKPYWREVTIPTPAAAVNHKPTSHTLLGSRTRVAGTSIILWRTHLNQNVKPFPGNHPLHGSEIVPAAVSMNTFLSAVTNKHMLSNVSFKVPVVVGPPRDVQVLLNEGVVQIASKLSESASSTADDDSSWLVHSHATIAEIDEAETTESIDISGLQAKISLPLEDSFSMDYLAEVGVSEMGFPWKVLEHLQSEAGDMLVKLHADPTADPSPHFSGTSWASILDAATSVSSTIFYKDPLLRMPTAISRVRLLSRKPPPKVCYIYVKRVADSYAADIWICDEEGAILIDLQQLAFAGIDGNLSSKGNVTEMVHKIAWPPVRLAEQPLNFSKVIFLASESPLLTGYQAQLAKRGIATQTVSEAEGLVGIHMNTVIIFVADGASESNDIYKVSAANCKKLLDAVKVLVKSGTQDKVFAITRGIFKGASSEALSQSALAGLARIVQSEEPEVFGGLIDVEDESFPMQAIKYAQGVDVVKIEDSVARNARLRPFPEVKTPREKSFKIRPQGTYLITGGLGALGLEVASFLAGQGAKRLVLVSRRAQPARHLWEAHAGEVEIQKMFALEAAGVSVYPVAVDMTTPDAPSRLDAALAALHLPPVLGIVHAAGTLANELVVDTTPKAFNSVIAPKILGALGLDSLFPVGSLDFMVFFSSCGQLLGFPGQAAYASGNSFLDSIATRRRDLGENAISIQWTSWRGLGMAASTKYVDAELAERAITDVIKEDAFAAWLDIFTKNTDHAVVLRTMILDDDKPSPHPILDDILVRNVPTRTGRNAGSVTAAPDNQTDAEPASGPELEKYLLRKTIHCVAETLGLAEDAVSANVALTELGVDSVMAVELRGRLQRSFAVKVGPTLIWNCPTVALLVGHFIKAKTKE